MIETVAALDLSLSASGVIVMDREGQTLLRETIATSTKETERQRLVYIGDKVVSLIQPFAPLSLMMEGPAHNARFGVHLAGRVRGAVDYAMEKAGMPTPLEVAPATLKKFATGRGGGEKSDVKMWVLSTWGIKFSDNNQADAYVLARMAGLRHGFFKMKSRHEGECLKTVLLAADLKDEARAIKLIKNDMRVCACGTKMKTGTELESGKCAKCLRGGVNGQA